jgi:hypothetical protein
MSLFSLSPKHKTNNKVQVIGARTPAHGQPQLQRTTNGARPPAHEHSATQLRLRTISPTVLVLIGARTSAHEEPRPHSMNGARTSAHEHQTPHHFRPRTVPTLHPTTPPHEPRVPSHKHPPTVQEPIGARTSAHEGTQTLSTALQQLTATGVEHSSTQQPNIVTCIS